MRLAIIAGGIVFMVLRANNLARPGVVATAITAGMNRPYPLNDIDVEDQNLQREKQAAGAVWARAHPGAKAENCPGSPKDFPVLVPDFRPGDVVIMDNLGSHKRPAIKTMIEAAGAELRVLPPESPDINPIEKAFSKLKALLRKGTE